jgi:cell division protease FtsH
MFPLAFSLLNRVETWSLTWLPILLMLALVYLVWRTLKMMPRTKPQQVKPESSGSIEWGDVAGCDEAKGELREVVDFLREPDRFKKLGATVPRGILLHGPPGTGKTLLAKAVARESGAQFFSQSASSFVEMFAGLGAARIRRLFEIAKKHRPAIIFIDELDAVGLARGFDMSREKDQTLNQLLVEMDGFADRGDLIVIAASNRVEGLDQALLRPGRFDRQVLVSPPDLRGREEILKVHTRNKPVAEVDFDVVARQTSGLTGADLANLCNEAAIFAGRDGRSTITSNDFGNALERVIAGLQTRLVITADEKRVIAYHEAGHALVAEMLPSAVSTHKISIIPRGQALGYTLHLPDEDRYLMSKPELLDELKVLLGGYVAEQIVFERTTTGAAGDLKRVVKISRAMIEDYGMGTQLFLANGSGSEALTSQATLHRRDEEQQGLVDEALFEARMLIMDNRATLDSLAQALLSKETLERAEIEAIIRPDDSAPERTPVEEAEQEAAAEAPAAEAPAEEIAPAAGIEKTLEPPEPVESNGSVRNGSVAPPPPRPSIAPPPNGSAAHEATAPVQQ